MNNVMTIKNKLIAAATFVAGLGFTSCSDGFFEREPDGEYITDQQLAKSMKWNPQIMLGEVNSISTSLYRWQTGGVTRQDDFGQKSTDLVEDFMSGDLVFSRIIYGWFSDAARLRTANKNQTRAYTLWRTFYRVIDGSNAIFDINGSDSQYPDDGDNQLYFAAAKTARAWAYFNLAVNYYGPDYETAKNKKVLPIYTMPADAYGAPQTLDSVYNLIFRDVNEAVAAYDAAAAQDVTPSSISIPGADVALTIGAYAALQKGDNALALQYAEAALDATDKEVLDEDGIFSGFNSVNNDNWMWGYDITSESTGGLCTFWGMMDYFTYSYQAAGEYKVINLDLFNSIPTTDARRSWFTAFGTNARYLMPANKFFDAARVAMGNAAWDQDIHFMRVEEPVLIAAEAAARLGNLSTAVEYLSAIVGNRDEAKAETLEEMTQEELLEEIRYNWRVEFFAEGRSLWTMKRFKTTAERPANDYYTSIGTYSYDDTRLTFAIPEAEIERNPLMSQADQ